MDPIRVFLIQFIQLYSYLLMARILLSWFPNISWYDQPWKGLRDVTDPVMEPFRRLIPPLGGLDLSPIILFFVLRLLVDVISSF